MTFCRCVVCKKESPAHEIQWWFTIKRSFRPQGLPDFLVLAVPMEERTEHCCSVKCLVEWSAGMLKRETDHRDKAQTEALRDVETEGSH